MTDDDKIDAIVDALTRAENQLTGPAYDGVFGTLDGWIPANFHVDFHKIRGRLLEAYSHTDLLGYIAEYLAMDENPETYSIPGEIMRDVSILAQYQEAVRLAEKVRQEKERELLADGMEPKKAALKARMEGEKAGLALLTDPEHAKTATIGANNRAGQSKKAELLRGKVGCSDSGDAFAEIIGRLANERDALGDFIPAPDLWEPLFSELGTAGADPKLVRNPHAPRKTRYDYTADGKAKHITLGRFETKIGEHRKKLSR